jgi:ATP-dependent helicase Lhr and Lhr-like helicase
VTNTGNNYSGMSDEQILDLFDWSVQAWWRQTFGSGKGLFTPPQRGAVPLIHHNTNVLICSPTGSGKTLSAFISIIDQLVVLSKRGELDNSVYCLYISPLKSLANDIHKNLEYPLNGILEIARAEGETVGDIRLAIRHGDIPTAQRAKMLHTTPHILNTTPETLAILLNSPRFREKLKTVRWVVVDEIHSLAGSKRGVHLSVSLERLVELKKETGEEFVRIGCSATIEPLEEVARFLAGRGREISIVDTRFARRFDLQLLCPVPDLISTPFEELNSRLYAIIHELVQQHRNTLIFTNTRNGAERVLYNLRVRYPGHYCEKNSGCHHGSMGTNGRIEIEGKLKSGEVKVVTSSTSLELGVDMPCLDLVLQIGSPKSVAALLQRIGRAGHSLHQVVKGRILVYDRDELVETAVMLRKGREGFVDRIHIPRNCLDVLIQHVFGMALERPWKVDDIARIVRRSYCYETLTDEDFCSVLDYLSGRYTGLSERNIYAKIWYDESTGMVGKRGRNARVIYFQNSGTIPDEFSCDVFTRDRLWVGKLDEKYLERLSKGDVFVIGGKRFQFVYRRGGNLYVDLTGDKPTIPSWVSEKLPLSFDLGEHVLKFKGEMIGWMHRERSEDVIAKLLREYPIDERSARSIYEIFEQQMLYAGADSIPTGQRIVVEEVADLENARRNYYVLTNYGLRFNDGFSRMVAYLISQHITSNVQVAIGDTGFLVSVPLSKKVDVREIFLAINEDTCEEMLVSAIGNTNLLKRLFRINASRSFMILRNYLGRKRSARRQQVSADMLISYAKKIKDFAVIKESYREILQDKFEIDNIKVIISGLQSGSIDISEKLTGSPSPMSFGIAALGTSDVVVVPDKLTLIKEFHRQVLERIRGVA